ncbi:MAG: CBS domain-containing protein [Desulfobacteraceae bacterium]|nr:MAG: CBS domain-containing protein [Desulfobacteraceae bacterium]
MQIITTHKNTDFDALASMVAAKVLYPEAVCVLPRTINPNVKAFMSIHKDIFDMHSSDEIDFDNVKRLIVVDTNNWKRLDRMETLSKRDDIGIILWDHHKGNGESDIKATWECREEIGANITLMVRRLKKEKKRISPIQATLFLTGLYEDTGNLTFPSSTAEDAYAAGFLLENRADLNVIGTFLRQAYGEKQKNILFEMLQTAKRSKINGYSVSINKLEINGHVNGLAVVVGMYREILNVDAAFGIFTNKEKEKCMVIARSSADSLDMGSVMRSMGGGGHPGAASAMLKSVNPAAVEEWIRELIEGNQQASVQISDIMSFPVFTVESGTSMEKVAALLREKGCTGLPVVDGEKLVGIISRRDFKKIKRESQLKSPVKAYMSTNIMTIEPGKSPIQAARLMVKHDIGRLPVVENGRIIGIITRSDSMLYFYDMLPD